VLTIDSSNQHARTTTVGPMLCLIGAALVSGCAQQPQVKGAWQDGAPRKQSFTKVLIVGVTPTSTSAASSKHSWHRSSGASQ
jgi:hypothetical protein